jgi:DNA-binding response OmpR family regulator
MARILLVEDDAFLAFDLAQRLERAGFTIAGPASTSTRALHLLAEAGCDAAVLDVHLGRGETSEPVARELAARGTPFVTVTGYSHEQRPLAFEGSPVLPKPIQFADLLAALQNSLKGDRC